MAKRPFVGSIHQAAWEEHNCMTCALYGKAGDCDILYALAYAALDDGTVSDEMADYMGYTGWSMWTCAQYEPDHSVEQVRHD